MKNHEKLYKIDTKGKCRVWWIESTDEAYRTHSGILDGQLVTSGWQYPTEKNVGKANQTSIAEQVAAEVAAKYERQQYQGKYAPTIDEASKGAKFIECTLASKYDPKKTTSFPYWSQPKLDGIRCLTSDDGMQSRNGKPLLSSVHIRDVLQSLFDEHPDITLDGELYNHDLKHDFEQIISLARKSKPTEEDLEKSARLVEYHVYDIITPDPMPYEQRKQLLEELVGDKFPMVKLVPAVIVENAEQVEEKLGEYLEAGYEGQMLRVGDAVYDHKRSKSLIKHKTFEDAEFEIVEILEGKGNWSGYAKAVVIRLEDGETQQSGMRGNQAFAKQLIEEKAEYEGNGSQATVRFQNRTSDGKLRFPIAVAFWKGGRDV